MRRKDNDSEKPYRYRKRDALDGGWIHLRPNQLYYTGFNELNLLIDTFDDPPIDPMVYLSMLADYCETTTTRGTEINVYVPEYLNGKRLTFDGTIELEVEPQNSVFPKSKAQTFLEQKASSYPIQKLDPQELAKAFTSANPDTIMATVRDLGDLVNLFQKGGLKLFDAYNALNCDGLVTRNTVLLKERDRNGMIEDARIIGWSEVYSVAEIFMSGNGLYVGAMPVASAITTPILGLGAATYYAMVDKPFLRYQNLWAALYKKNQQQKMNDFFRVAIFQRYQFMLHARDKIRHEIFQSKRAELLYNDKTSHHFIASYHLNMFYLMLWGCLDNIAWAFNYFYGLGFDDLNEKSRMQCTFGHKEYRKKLKVANLDLFKIVAEGEYARWIVDLKIKRHPAAHRQPIFLSTLMDSDGKKAGDTFVVGDKDSKMLIYDAINHLNYDIDMFQKLMASICSLFGV